MSRRRQIADQPLSGLNNVRTPRPSEPLSFHEPPPTTTLGVLVYSVREILHIARDLLNCVMFGDEYDMTPEEKARAAKLREEHAQAPVPKEVETLMLGYIRNTHELRWNPNSSTVILCGPVDEEEDPYAHAVAAYTHLGPSADSEHSRIIKYIGPSDRIALPENHGSRSFPTFEPATYGSLQSFLLTTTSYPTLANPAIPPPTAQSALVSHWLLNIASAISSLHSHGVAHHAVALNLVWLRTDFSVALFDLSCSVFIHHSDEYDEDVPVSGNLLGWGSVAFPTHDVEETYYSGATPEDAMTLGKLIDVFDFGTVAWRLLTRTIEGPPEWKMPRRGTREKTWSLTELRQRLRDAVGIERKMGPYDLPGMDLVRRCWTLEYQDGAEVLEALQKMVLQTGLTLQQSDEVKGVAQAVKEFKENYKPKSYLGNEIVSERGY